MKKEKTPVLIVLSVCLLFRLSLGPRFFLLSSCAARIPALQLCLGNLLQQLLGERAQKRPRQVERLEDSARLPNGGKGGGEVLNSFHINEQHAPRKYCSSFPHRDCHLQFKAFTRHS